MCLVVPRCHLINMLARSNKEKEALASKIVQALLAVPPMQTLLSSCPSLPSSTCFEPSTPHLLHHLRQLLAACLQVSKCGGWQRWNGAAWQQAASWRTFEDMLYSASPSSLPCLKQWPIRRHMHLQR